MNVRAPFLAHARASVWCEPGERSFDHPAMSSEARLRLDAAMHDAVIDGPRRAGSSASSIVVALVGIDLAGPTTGTARAAIGDRQDRIDHPPEQPRVVHVRRTRSYRQRHARGVDDQVMLGTGSAAVRRVRAELLAPFLPVRCAPRCRLGSSRCGRPPLGGETARDAVGPTRRRPASHAQALWSRLDVRGVVHHSDRGSQYRRSSARIGSPRPAWSPRSAASATPTTSRLRQGVSTSSHRSPIISPGRHPASRALPRRSPGTSGSGGSPSARIAPSTSQGGRDPSRGGSSLD